MKHLVIASALSAILAVPVLGALPFHDDFESGMGNWTKFPGAADALIHWGPDKWKSIDPGPWGDHEGHSAYQPEYFGGGNGWASYHNFGDESGFIKAEVYIFEDLNPREDPTNGAMTLTPDNESGEPDFADYLRIGVLQGSGSNTFYSYRSASGGFVVTDVACKSGWTKLGIEADAGIGGQVRFYIDDNLVGTSTRSVEDLSAITLGQNFSNYENFWYDGVNVTPEPASALLLLGAPVLLRRRKR